MSTGTRTFRKVLGADLFAGAGGFSSGLMRAAADLGAEVDLLAINHWDVAIQTHRANHGRVRHLCTGLDNTNPRELVPGGRLHLLLAAPECIHHSRARGGRPMSDQSRASAWHVLRWAEALYIDRIVIENVQEFQSWGPLGAGGRPLQRKKGALFQQFIRSLRALGYRVEWRVLRAADYGDPTTRERLFIQARRDGAPICWPAPTHVAPTADPLGVLEGQPRWRAAREIIDWSLPSRSIYGRKRLLAPNTLRRIFVGVERFCGLPFVLGQQSCAAPRSVREPLPTVATAGAISLAEPFLVVLRNPMAAQSLDAPGPTLTTANHYGLAQPFILPPEGYYRGNAPRSLEAPAAAVTSRGGGHLAEPFIFPLNHGKGDHRTYRLDATFPTVTSVDAWGMAEPSLVEFYGERSGQEPRVRDLDRPFGTVCGSRTHGLTQPFLVRYHGTDQGAHCLDEPAPTVTARDRLALVSPEVVEQVDGQVIGWLDILFRMLQPRELARAQGFPDEYEFHGTREERVKQIGNAVPVGLATALCRAALCTTGGE